MEHGLDKTDNKNNILPRPKLSGQAAQKAAGRERLMPSPHKRAANSAARGLCGLKTDWRASRLMKEEHGKQLKHISRAMTCALQKKERRNGENWMMDGRATVRGMKGICVGFGLTCSLDLRDACWCWWWVDWLSYARGGCYSMGNGANHGERKSMLFFVAILFFGWKIRKFGLINFTKRGIGNSKCLAQNCRWTTGWPCVSNPHCCVHLRASWAPSESNYSFFYSNVQYPKWRASFPFTAFGPRSLE